MSAWGSLACSFDEVYCRSRRSLSRRSNPALRQAQTGIWSLSANARKPPDWCAVYACADCHDAIDRRNAATSGLWGFEDLLRALIETQRRLWAAGLIQEGTK